MSSNIILWKQKNNIGEEEKLMEGKKVKKWIYFITKRFTSERQLIVPKNAEERELGVSIC